MKRIAGVIAILVAIFFDSIFFARVNVYGVAPDVMLAFTVSFAVHAGSLSGAVFGGVGGLFMDMLFGRMLGLNAAIYLVAGLCGGFFHQKFYADNVIVPGITAVTASFLKDAVYALTALLMGGRFHLGWMLVQYMLPAAVVTGGVCMLAHLAFRPVVGRQVGHGKGIER